MKEYTERAIKFRDGMYNEILSLLKEREGNEDFAFDIMSFASLTEQLTKFLSSIAVPALISSSIPEKVAETDQICEDAVRVIEALTDRDW